MSKKIDKKFTFNEIKAIINQLPSLDSIKSTKFQYQLFKIKSAIQKSTEEFNEFLKTTDCFKKVSEYDEKRIELCKKYAEKDEDGNPKSNGNNFVIDEKNGEFKVEIFKLYKEYENDLKALEEIKEENKIEVTFTPIDLNNTPDDLDGSQMNLIMIFSEEDDDKEE